MRDLLAHADLARYAGQFVWLELNYDEAKNRAFLAKYHASATPTFFIIDPADGVVAAAQTGAMSLTELTQFLDRGTTGLVAKRQTPADAALKRGDVLLTQQPADAARAYAQALRLAAPDWSNRELAQASLVSALQDSQQWHECADTAATEAVHMNRNVFFARTIVAGMWCLRGAGDAPWLNAEVERLEPFAREALALPTTVRDHRDTIYRALMSISVMRKDTASAAKWGNIWLAELDSTKPKDDDERSALDIARVENIQIYGDPARILPALAESERVMPHNYIPSLRLAQMEDAAKHYDSAISACDRGLARKPGSAGRAWILQIKAHALREEGRSVEARHAFEEALQAAQQIPDKKQRDNNLKAITTALRQ